MTEAQQTYIDLFKKVSERVKTSSALREVLPWLVGGGALAAGVPLAYRHGKKRGEEEESKKRPLAFGAGALTGLVAPQLLQHAKKTMGLGLNPGDSNAYYGDDFTEF